MVLNEKMQERLDAWRNKRNGTTPTEKVNVNKGRSSARFVGKNDYGDVNSLEELEEEHRLSQNRR